MVDAAWLAGTADQFVQRTAAGLVPHEQAVAMLARYAGRDPFVLREAVTLVKADAAVALLHEAAMEAETPLADGP